MFKHTKASMNIIMDEISFLSYLANIISSAFLMAYLVYASIVGRGYLAVNIVLCVLCAANLTTYLITRKRKEKEAKRVRKFVYHFYRISKIILNAIPLGTVLYLLAFTNDEINRIEIVLLPLMIISWIFQVVFEITYFYVENRLTLLVDGFELDVENAIKPVLKVKNFISGNNEEPRFDSETISEHNRALLTERAEEDQKKKEQNSPKSEISEKINRAKEAIKEFIKR